MFRKVVLLTAFTAFVLSTGAVLADDPQIDRDKIKDARNSTVLINGEKVSHSTLAGNKDSTISFNGVGAGVIVDPRGYIITNYHVIEGIRKPQVRTYDGKEYIGQYISHDPTTDIALIKITPVNPLTPILIGDSSAIDILDRVVVAGHPYGLEYSVNSGEISGLPRELEVKSNLKYYNMIQISAAINPGNSGGPLFNIYGEMIGVNSALREGSNSIAFAIPVDFVMEVGAELFNQYTSQFCYHGIRFKEVDVNLIGTPNINVGDYKILAVDSIEPGSPAEEAELLPGDVLLVANDLKLDRKLDFQRALVDKKVNDTVKLVFDRKGTQYETDLVLASPKSRSSRNQTYIAEARPSSQVNHVGSQSVPTFRGTTSNDALVNEYVWNAFGLRVTPVSQEELNRRFTDGKKNPQYEFDGAVQIEEVRPGSVFDWLKMQKGDMLAGMLLTSKMEGWNIMRANDLKYLAERWSPEELGGNEVTVLVIRNQKLLKGILLVNRNDVTANAETTTRR